MPRVGPATVSVCWGSELSKGALTKLAVDGWLWGSHSHPGAVPASHVAVTVRGVVRSHLACKHMFVQHD